MLWSAEELDACYVVCDHAGQQLAYVYFEDEQGRRSVTHLGRITKRPLTRGRFSFFARRGTQPNLARVQLLYVPFFLFLAFFFMTLFLAVGPLPDRKHGVGQMNAA
jgi:hypothetical protein